jgi:hypothetical protein
MNRFRLCALTVSRLFFRSIRQMAHRERLVAFYAYHKVDKTSEEITAILQSFDGAESDLFDALENKYGPPAAPTDAARTEAGSVGALKSSLQELRILQNTITTCDPLATQMAFENLSQAAAHQVRAVTDDEISAATLRLNTSQSTFTGAVTRMQHASASFIAIAQHVMDDLTERTRRDSSWQVAPTADLSQVSPNHTRDTTARFTRRPAANDEGPRESQRQRMVFNVVPLGGEHNILSDVIVNQAAAGDIIMIHPGDFYENIIVADDIELRPAIDTDDARVNIHPSNPDVPVLQVVGDGKCRVSGLFFRPVPPAKNQPAPVPCPLVSVSARASLEMRNVCFIKGGGGALCIGSAQARFSHCTFRRCVFAAVYAKDAAFACMQNCSFIDCEVAVRARDATFSMELCEVRGSASDGVTVHGGAKGIVDRSKITGAAENGVLLSPSCEVLLSGTTVERSGKHGVYAPQGADFAMPGCAFHHNALGDTSRPPPTHSRLVQPRN